MKRSLLKLFLLLVGFSFLLLQSCREITTETALPSAEQFDNETFLRWNQLVMDLDRFARGYRPGPAPRALAYLGYAAYETAVPGMPGYNSLGSQFNGLDLPTADANAEYHWAAAVNASYAYLMPRLFFHMENEYANLYQRIEQTRRVLRDKYAQETTPEILERSENWGIAVARAIYEWETSDDIGHNAFLTPQPTSYAPPTGPGKWQPTPPDFSRAVFPQWGNVRTFAIRDDEKVGKPPIPYSEHPNSLFYTQALEVYNTVKYIKENPSDRDAYEQKWIAEFWSDDILNLTFSPPVRLVAIANQVVEREETNLAGCAELYAKLGMAMHDNGVAIWKSKYAYNIERPVSYIRRVVSQQYPDAADWLSLLNNIPAGVNGVTPAFPAYPSGHSGFGGAGAKILSSFFEYTPTHPGTYTFTDRCHFNRAEFLGTPRTFSSFAELGVEDAVSRIPLGVHFRMDCVEGLRIGELAAQRVLELPWKR